MGLDISHIKATLNKPVTTDPYELGGMTEDTFNGFDVPFTHFEKYIQKIDCANILKTAILVKNENDLEYVKEWFKVNDYEILFENNQDSLEKKLREYELRNKLGKLHNHIDKSPQKWDLLYHYEIIKKTGFYEVEEGYQRKGMNSDFGYFYQNDKSEFVLKDDFERAYKCIDFYWESDTKEELILRKRNFKENFIDKFEFGASYLSVSY